MNIELTTENLQKLCRICLNDGELNIWNHKLKLPINNDETENFLEEEITIYGLMQEFDNPQHTVLALSTEMDMICCSCAAELKTSAIFNRKMQQATKQIKKLYREALVLENYEEDQVERRKLETPDHSQETFYSIDRADVDEDCNEQYLTDDLIQIPLKMPQNTPSKTQPKILLSSGVTQMLAHFDDDNAQKRAAATFIQTASPPKRQRTKQTRRFKKMHELPSASASVVVTKFIPTAAAQMRTFETLEQTDEGNSVDAPAWQNVRTMEYEAIEVKGTQLKEIRENIDEETSPDTVYLCKHCPQAFSASQFLITHVRKHHVCKFCTSAFAETTALYEHIRTAHPQHKCAVCNKVLSSHSNLRGHIKRMHGLELPVQTALLNYRIQSETEENSAHKLELVEEDELEVDQCNEIEEHDLVVEESNDATEY